MDTVFKFTGSLCTTVYILGLLFNLTDISYTQKTIRLTIAVYIIVNILMPLKNLELNFDFTDSISDSTIEISAEDYVISQAEKNMKQSIISQLNDKNISYSDISVHINKQSNSVYIDNIVFYGLADNDKQIVNQLFENQGTIISFQKK